MRSVLAVLVSEGRRLGLGLARDATRAFAAGRFSGETAGNHPDHFRRPPAPLPPEPLRHLHFNDALRYVIAAAEMERSGQPR